MLVWGPVDTIYQIWLIYLPYITVYYDLALSLLEGAESDEGLPEVMRKLYVKSQVHTRIHNFFFLVLLELFSFP